MDSIQPPYDKTPPPKPETYTGINTAMGIEAVAMPPGEFTIDELRDAFHRRSVGSGTGEISKEKQDAIEMYLQLIEEHYGSNHNFDAESDPSDVVKIRDKYTEQALFMTITPLAGKGQIVIMALEPPDGHWADANPSKYVDINRLQVEQWRACLIDLKKPTDEFPVIIKLDYAEYGVDYLSLFDDLEWAHQHRNKPKISDHQFEAVANLLNFNKSRGVAVEEMIASGELVINVFDDGETYATFFFANTEETPDKPLNLQEDDKDV